MGLNVILIVLILEKYISFFVLNMLSGNRSPNLNEYFATVTIAAAAVGPNKASPVPKTPLLTT